MQPKRLAIMGGAYGNVPALEACLADAKAQGCDTRVFLGDATGCCGHSDETLALVREHFDVLLAGNHEQQAASGALECGCGYASPEDERLGCQAHELALQSLSEANRQWLGTWAQQQRVLETAGGRLLLCHGSPDQTNEFLFESELEPGRLRRWLDAHGCLGLLCTHTGLPWLWEGEEGRFACNVGAVGKPDHDADPAVHYALLDMAENPWQLALRRVSYDHHAWADQLKREALPEVFIEPLRTGRWTTGVRSLPQVEQPSQPRPIGRPIPVSLPGRDARAAHHAE